MRVIEIASATGGEVLAGDPARVIRGISTDSREIRGGELFVALVAERDGHGFAPQAIRAGAGALLVQRRLSSEELPDPTLPVILVKDTLHALGDLAAAWLARYRTSCKVIGITGSSGKTTSKEMLAAILQQCAPTLKTAGNYNNLIGLPLTLFQLSSQHRFAVLEMGMNAFGEIARLTEIARPDVGWITIVAPAHLEGVGSIEGVARAKGELFAGLGSSDIGIVNADDPLVLAQSEGLRGERIYYSTDPDIASRLPEDAKAVYLLQAAICGSEGFDVTAQSFAHGRLSFHLPLVGQHQISNALGAIAAAGALGIEAEAVIAGLKALQPEGRRLRVIHTNLGVHLIDDCYNSNPASKRAALHTLAQLAAGSPTIAVLGDMLELGESEAALHAQIGRAVVEHQINALFAFGARSRAMVEAAREAGLQDAHHFEDIEELWQALAPRLRSELWILVKGSRGMRLERITQRIEATSNFTGELMPLPTNASSEPAVHSPLSSTPPSAQDEIE
jgi:UDP-N-acetylmuramoyl-tripeptide--D-alanyl-D-alanine ligase